VITADALNRARRTVVVVPRTTGPTRDRLSSSPRPRLGQIRWRFVTKSAQWTSIVSARVEGGFRPKICDLSKMACGASLNSEQRRTRADRIKPRDREPSKTVADKLSAVRHPARHRNCGRGLSAQLAFALRSGLELGVPSCGEHIMNPYAGLVLPA
jgi:hypothetical protein